MFEQATKLGLRFSTVRGDLTVEDLWNLPLTGKTRINLDDIAKGLNKELQSSEESFVETKTKEDSILNLKFDIVKHIIKVKLEERDAAKLSAKKAQEREKLLQILASKQDEELNGLSKEEVEARLAAL